MFDPSKGIILPKYLSTQKRITDGMLHNKFVFYPNRLVTAEVFNLLL